VSREEKLSFLLPFSPGVWSSGRLSPPWETLPRKTWNKFQDPTPFRIAREDTSLVVPASTPSVPHCPALPLLSCMSWTEIFPLNPPDRGDPYLRRCRSFRSFQYSFPFAPTLSLRHLPGAALLQIELPHPSPPPRFIAPSSCFVSPFFAEEKPPLH